MNKTEPIPPERIRQKTTGESQGNTETRKSASIFFRL